MRRDTVTAYRRRARDTERMVDDAVAEVAAERAAEWTAAKERAAKARAARRQFTRDDLVGAGFVHDGVAWRKVVRLNAKTVSVESGYSWTDRVPFARIIAVQGVLDGADG